MFLVSSRSSPGARAFRPPSFVARRSAAVAGPRIPAPRLRAFTLVELIVVMVLLLIVASMVAPRMSSFFRGRALSSEARRMLSLIHHAQSQAVAEGAPVLVWIDAVNSRYGTEIQSSHSLGDERSIAYTADPSLTFETPFATEPVASEDGDELLGMGDLPAIRFNPDGFFDEASVQRIVIRQGAEGALELAPTANRLGYEIRPANISN